MKRITFCLFFVLLSLAAIAQPVTRFRVTQLFPPTDTTTQYFIQAGNYADTVKWVPVDSISSGGTNIYNADGTLSSERSVDLDTYALTYDVSGADLDSFVVRFVARDDIVSGWYTGDNPGRINLVADKYLTTELTSILNYDGVEEIVIGNFNDSLEIQGDRVFINPLNLDTDNSVTHVLALDANDQLVVTDGSGTAAADGPTEGYALAETATADLQNVGTTWEALEAQTSPTNSTDWSFSAGTDLFTYSGTDAAKYLISFSVCAKFSSSTFREIRFTVQENGTDGNAKAVMISGADSGVTDCASGFDIVTANNSDTFGLGMILDTGSATNVTIESSQLAITKLVGQ